MFSDGRIGAGRFAKKSDSVNFSRLSLRNQIGEMLRDLRYALHLIVKDRWYSAVAVVALALGIGVNATVFTLVNAVLIRGLPYQDSAQSLHARSASAGRQRRRGVSFADLEDWRSAVEDLRRPRAPSTTTASTSATTGPPRRARAARTITANAFSLLAMQPVLGRDFTPGRRAARAPRASSSSATRCGRAATARTAASSASTLRLDGKPATIVGVMPEGMQFPVEHRNLDAARAARPTAAEARATDSCRSSGGCGPTSSRAAGADRDERHRARGSRPPIPTPTRSITARPRRDLQRALQRRQDPRRCSWR